MSKIIQFTHPGGEHKPDNKDLNHKGWNIGCHARKFLLAEGDYVVNDTIQHGKVVFWGEWEPPSFVKKLSSSHDSNLPGWLHIPYLPSILPDNSNLENTYQNTDPFVFGSEFRYFVCKQYQDKKRRITSLAKLEKGDIILFGATKGKLRETSFFQLDTVFVVSHFLEYDISDADALKDHDIGIFREIVYKMAFPKPASYALKLRLYFGATHDKPINGMYSFAPCKIWESREYGFQRVQLKDLEYLTNNLNAAPKITNTTIEESFIFWNKLRVITRNQGCYEGVHFTFPSSKN